MIRKVASAVILMLLLISMLPFVFAAKFNLGDTVEVFNTGASGLLVRDAAAGNIIGKKYDGNRGMILAGPQSASLGGVVYTWWKVRWGDDALEGWSAEDYLKYVYITPSTKFSIGDFVKVYNTGASLVVRTDPPALSYKDSEVDGTFGKVEGGPFYGVAAGKAGFYHFWKVNYGSVVGWSAEDWLMKGTPSDLTVEDIWIEPASFDPGSAVTIYSRIKNIGASAAVSDQGLQIRAYLDGGICYQEGIEGLGAGYAYTFHWGYTWPSDTNWHTVEVRVDPDNYIIESNENNNIRSESFQATAPPPFDFTLGISPSSGSAQQGGSVSATVTVTLTSGSAQTVTLTTSGLPSGTYATFNPSSGYPTFTSTFTISTSTTTPTGTFYITIIGSGGGLTRTATYTLTVTPLLVPDFSITASPVSLTIQQGSSGSSTITITSINGFNQPVQLTASGVPAGATATFNPQQVTPPADGSTISTLTVSVGAAATPGSYTLTVTGTSGALTHSTYISLEIPPPVNQPPNKPTAVFQYRSDGVTVIPEGGTTPESTVVFKATVSDPDGDSVRLEIELRQIGEPFTGQPTPETISDYVSSGSEVTITRSGLVNADYHWRYRAKDIKGAISDWTEFGTTGNIDFTVSIPDTTPPATVTDLWIFFISTYTLALSWTAPGDDGNIGTASEYDLRYSTSPITEANWDLATRVTGESKPSEAGSHETFYVRGLSSGTTYYFALKTADEVPNWSGLSNVVSETTPQNQPPIADAGFDRLEVSSGDLITFDGSNSYDPDLEGEVVSYEWDFGDGTTAEGKIVPHRFRGAQIDPETQELRTKEYKIRLTVKDNEGAIDSDIAYVTVAPLQKTMSVRGGPFQAGEARMTVTYNWVDEINGEDMYIVCKITILDYGIVGMIQPSITSGDNILWRDVLFGSMYTKTYVSPFVVGKLGTSCPIAKLTFPEGTFEGIEVRSSDRMNLLVRGVCPPLGIPGIPSPVIGELSTTFNPDSPIEALSPSLRKLVELDVDIAKLCSSAELRVYDLQGRVTGLVNGEVKEEIPDSAYFNNTVVVPFPSGSYRYELVGIENSSYGMIVASFVEGRSNNFTAIDIPISMNVIHQYTIDWDVLSQGEEGVTVQVDSDGDGVFEHTFTSDSELTQSEFLAQMALYTFLIVWGEETFVVSVESNSTVSNFAFNQPDKEISFNVTGEVGTVGFCNVTIPKALLYAELGEWIVLIDDLPVPSTITENETQCCLYFTYTHSTHKIQIIGTWVIGPPPPTYSLTITTTVDGTTDPAPGTYSYTASSTVEVTAIPEANYLLDYWELDSVNVGSVNPYTVLMDKNHTLKAVFSPVTPPLSASISPLSASILVGQSVTFASTVSGGYTPYSYQWYLNGNPVSGATSDTWTFTPATSGIYYVYLKVTDDTGNTTQSETARITVATVPVGGYSVPIQLPTIAKPATIHIALLTILTAIFITIKRKTKRKTPP